jgi:hypothetical protein
VPSPYRGERPYPGQGYNLRQAAADNKLMVVYCGFCRRRQHYLCADLVTVWDPQTEALTPPLRCSRGCRAEYLHVSLRVPTSDDIGHLVIRRPDGVRTVQKWRDQFYG